MRSIRRGWAESRRPESGTGNSNDYFLVDVTGSGRGARWFKGDRNKSLRGTNWKYRKRFALGHRRRNCCRGAQDASWQRRRVPRFRMAGALRHCITFRLGLRRSIRRMAMHRLVRLLRFCMFPVHRANTRLAAILLAAAICRRQAADRPSHQARQRKNDNRSPHGPKSTTPIQPIQAGQIDSSLRCGYSFRTRRIRQYSRLSAPFRAC